MSIWTRISDALAALGRGEGLSEVFAHLRTPPERRVGFTIAVIALGAKMAKADGRVTRDEVSAFRRVFTIPEGDEANAARVFNLARQDVAGFDAYARQIRAMFGESDESRAVLCDLLEGLFQIALADGDYHPAEHDYLAQVAEIFGIPEKRFDAMRARLVPEGAPDPWAVLGVTPDDGIEAARTAWKQAVRDTHPDAMRARGVPSEAVQLAEDKLAALNHAWDQISSEAA